MTQLAQRISLLALALCLVAFPAIAQNVADVQLDASGVYFQPQVSYGQLILTVTGPDDFNHRAVFGGADVPSFSLDRGAVDGSYSYELRVVPAIDEETRELLIAARESGDQSIVGELKAAGKIPAFALVQSGGFSVVGGLLVADDRPEVVEKAQTFTTDLIVQGSACIGVDCTSSESFGFDTLRLKENNLRIHFNDTSASASFPSNDWRIIANDSSNGGDNYLAIEDSTAGNQPFRVDAGAGANALRVASSGSIGIGTGSPNGQIAVHVVNGNTPTLRLEQDGSSGFQSQTYDIAANEANFFIRDVTNGSKLFFRSKPGAPEDSIFVAADGDIGLGTDNPQTNLHVRRASATANLRVEGDAVGIDLIDSGATADQGFGQFLLDAGTFRMRGINDAATAETATGVVIDLATGGVGVNCSSSATDDFVVADGAGPCNSGTRSWINAGDTAVSGTSSRTYKENLSPIAVENILDKVSEIDVYHYDFIDGPKDRIGLMAEDFHQIFRRGSDKLLSGQEIDMAMWLAVKELAAQNKALVERLDALEGGAQD